MVRRGVYSDYIQNRVIQAQYYRDPVNEQGILRLDLKRTRSNIRPKRLFGKEYILTRFE